MGRRFHWGHSLVRYHPLAAALVAFGFGAAPVGPFRAQEMLPVGVELGDFSLTKLLFIVAAEGGIYERNRLKVSQFISPRAAELIRQSSGLVVPKEFVHTGPSDINIGGGGAPPPRLTPPPPAPQRSH